MRCWIKVAGATAVLAVVSADLGLRIASSFGGRSASGQSGVERLASLLPRHLPKGDMDWTAFATLLLVAATVLLAIATFVLVNVARFEIATTREDNKLQRTLDACIRYESDATISHSVGVLGVDPEKVKANPAQFGHELNMVLNYLDTIAIGIRQKIYDETICRDYLGNIVKRQCDRYLSEAILRQADLRLRDFEALLTLHRQWSDKQMSRVA